MKTLVGGLLLAASTLAMAGGETVRYEINGQPYEGYMLHKGKEAPTVLLIHDWDGLTDYEVKRANMLAEMGYSVFAADLFGAGNRPTEVKDKRQHTSELYKDREKLRTLMAGALQRAGEAGMNIDNAVAMGYCFGGSAVLELARAGTDMKGFATFHGGLQTPAGQDYAKVQGEIIVFHGTSDSAVSMDDFAALAKQLEAQSVTHEMITYSGAEHAFTVFGGDRYQQLADDKSWSRFSDFIATRTQ